MKVLIVSDTHGRHGNLRTVLTRVGRPDMLIHCGDVEDGERHIREMVDCEIHMVKGNNDFFSSLEKEDVFEIGRYRVLLTHGHIYRVGMGVERLKEAARTRGASIVMFGHTHRPVIDQMDSVTILNPGSISQPRQDNHKPSFILMDLDREGIAHYALNYLE